MCVLYMSEEPFSVSMLEAALIEKYRGILPIYICDHICFLNDSQISLHLYCIPLVLLNVQGKPGCRNVRSGGETVSLEPSDWKVYMCYVVYRSFKEKPA